MAFMPTRGGRGPSTPIIFVPTLNDLVLSGALVAGVASTGMILNATTGSVIASTVPGLTVNSPARTYSYNGAGSAGSVQGLTETLAGATFSPRNNTVTIVSASIPAFTSNPSISPASGNTATTFTAIDGAMSNGGVVLGRRWLLNGTSIGTGTTIVPGAQGSLVLENTGTGNVVATSTAVTVAATGTPTPSPSLTMSGTPAPASVGSSDTFAPTISGGTPPYTLSLLSGTLPPGRTINGSARTVTGTYTTAGAYSYVLRATDSVAATADLAVDLTVSAAGMTDNIAWGNRADYPNTTVSLNTDNTSRQEHYGSPEGEGTNFRPFFVWQSLASNGSTAAGAASSLEYEWEYPEGVYHPVTWNGSSILTTSGNATYTADPVIDSRTGLPLVMPANAKYWEWTCYLSTSSRAFPAVSRPAPPATLGISDGKRAGRLADGRNIPADTSSLIGWGMSGVNCTIKKSGARAFLTFGDSLVAGQADATAAGPRGESGFMSRYLDPKFSHIRIARGGFTAQNFATILGGTAFPNYIAQLGITDVVIEVGINDLEAVMDLKAGLIHPLLDEYLPQAVSV